MAASKKGKKDTSMAAKLKGLSNEWNEGNENPIAGFGGWPDGSYHTRVKKAHVNESKNGRLQVTFELEDVDGNEESIQFKHCGLDVENNPDCIKYLQKDLRTMGFEDFAISKLEGICEEITDNQTQLGVEVKTTTGKDGKEYTNTYINNLIED